MSKRRDASTLVTAIFAVLASVLVHAVLWPVGNRIVAMHLSGAPLPQTAGAMEVSLLPANPEDEPDDEAKEPEPPEVDEDDQLVKLDALENEARPDDTNYVSEFDHRVEREQRAPLQRPRKGQGPPTSGSSGAPTEASSASPQHSNEESSSRERQPLPLSPQGLRAAASGPAGRAVPRLDPRDMPGISETMRQEWGSPGTMDALDPNIEEGDGNLLNTRRFRYASFFNRVRDQVAENWDPQSVLQTRDPQGRITGRGPRKTILAISLNADGSLNGISIRGASGASFLDEEAIRAVRAAAPFSNPPPQLVDPATGHIDFLFGFILEVGGAKRIFRYRR